MSSRAICELLTSAPDGDGVVHAFYASAARTLCNKPKPLRVKGWPARPTCATCVTTARAFHRIDGSCPTNWHGLQVLEEVAAVERLGPDATAASSSTGPRVVRTVEGIPPEAIGLTAFYTPESVVSAIQRWAAEHDGEPPKSTEWVKSLPGWPPVRRQSSGSSASGAKRLPLPDSIRRITSGSARWVLSRATRRGGASRDRVALAVLAAGRAFVETLERELLEALESEAA